MNRKLIPKKAVLVLLGALALTACAELNRAPVTDSFPFTHREIEEARRIRHNVLYWSDILPATAEVIVRH